MKDIYSELLILEKASLLCKSIAASYHPDISRYQVSLSIGVAVITGNKPFTYQQLLQRADKALYMAKNNGKNRFEIYNSTMDITKQTNDSLKNDAVTFYTYGQSYQILIDTALDILLQSENEETAIKSILKFLGVSLSLYQSYTSLFTDNEINVIVQWSEYDAHRLPDCIPLSRERVLEKFNNDGVFLCSNTSELIGPEREICTNLNNGAILQCLICKNDKIIGFAGFSAKKEPRIWTQDEIDILQTITKIITNSVIKLAGDRIQ